MNKYYNEKEKKKIVSQLFKLGLYDLADEFESDGMPRVFSTKTGKHKHLSGNDIRNINIVNDLYDSRTFVIIRADDLRDDIYDPVDFFLGLDNSGYTQYIGVNPQSGAVSCPSFYPGYAHPYCYSIECFMYNKKRPNSNAWHVLTSVVFQPTREFDNDTDNDDLPF